jgi:NADH dehydrogenase
MLSRMPSESGRILITGANGHLGRQLIGRIAERAVDGGRAPAVRALVRSERAAEQIRASQSAQPDELLIRDYADVESMREAAEGCTHVVHLVGIIKETRGATYHSAHEQTCEVLAEAAVGAQRLVYLSIFGANPDSENACLASKGRAAKILEQSAIPTTVLRVPMVIGPEDFASAALRGDGRARLVPLIGGGTTMQQPIDSRDVVEAILGALDMPGRESVALDLGGPERLTHRALVQRAGELYRRKPWILPIPMSIGRAFAHVMARLLANPPITPAMFDVLQQDDRIDEAEACKALGLELRPLEDTLRSFVGPDSVST